MARATLVLALFALVTLPGAVYARSQSGKVLRLPIVVESRNSQTMDLLDGYLNTNPTGIGGAEIAIIDGTALSSEGDDASFFADSGQQGSGQISVYVVRKGDTLQSIAKMFGVSTNTILWANDIKNGRVSEGQELVILPVSGVRHIVKKGDTLQSIAKSYKADLEEILDYNDLTANSKIAVGDVVLVPNGQIGSSGSSSVKKNPIISGVANIVGYFMRPLSGGIKSQGIHGHNGVDLAARTGTPVLASADGKVIVSRPSGYNGGYGSYVVVSHANGTQTLYAHLSRVDVSVGQTVNQGNVIGAVGNTGRSTGPHLHFEVRGARNPF